jgi:hypothetical protein
MLEQADAVGTPVFLHGFGEELDLAGLQDRGRFLEVLLESELEDDHGSALSKE